MDIDPDQPETMPSDCRPFDGINPADGKTWKLYVRNKTMDQAVKVGSGKVKELAYTVRDVVLNLTAIFRGDRDEGEAEWWIYVGCPEKCYDYRTGDSRRPWAEKVFVVKFDKYRILQWFGWMKADPPDYKLPKDFQSIFDEKVL